MKWQAVLLAELLFSFGAVVCFWLYAHGEVANPMVLLAQLERAAALRDLLALRLR